VPALASKTVIILTHWPEFIELPACDPGPYAWPWPRSRLCRLAVAENHTRQGAGDLALVSGHLEVKGAGRRGLPYTSLIRDFPTCSID
jgi:hypothetical protein